MPHGASAQRAYHGIVRCLPALLALTAFAQTYDVSPSPARQGDTLRVRASRQAESARMHGRTIRLYPQSDGGSLGLMPVPAEEAPGEYKLEFLGKGGEVLHSAAVTVRDARFPRQNVTIGRETAELKPSPGEQEAFRAFTHSVSGVRYWTEPLQLPVPGCMTSPFGVQRLLNGKPTGSYHAGLDQRSPAGRPIRAITGGVVKIAGQFNLRGGAIAIDHGQGLESTYFHMSKTAAEKGATVKPGDIIGYVGSTGRSNAPHLHWTLYANGVPVNPLQWVKVQPCAPARPRTTARPRKK